MSRRTYDGKAQVFAYDFLLLSIEDARDLSTALGYHVGQADRG